MRILLIGEYSRLHNSLKEGLVALGHDVKIIGNGDGFKGYPVDYCVEAKWCATPLLDFVRRGINSIFSFDIATIEYGIRFYFHLTKLKKFDVVQLINEAPIKTIPLVERFLLKKIVSQNTAFFVLSSGIDTFYVAHLLEKKLRYSIVDPYWENQHLKKKYQYILNYQRKSHQKLHQYVYSICKGIIASDVDYLLSMTDKEKFLGLIPNPITVSKFKYEPLKVNDKIIIFLGINRLNYFQKGIFYFEEALELIKLKYPNKVTIKVSENVPYADYIELYNSAHIHLDQVYAYDQGYNALESMAKGKVVVTGAENEFYEQYKLTNRVAINALPDVNKLVEDLSFLIENPEEIVAIGERARQFIEKEHDSIMIAKKYLTTWEANK